jgi:hypothetical protein
MYVKAVVVVKPFKGQKTYVSSVIQPVNDYNQISYHLLSVMLAHAQRTKGPLPKPDQSGGQQNNQTSGNNGGFNGGVRRSGNDVSSVQINSNQDPLSIVKNSDFFKFLRSRVL